jgi:class 3 adenylate cyclase
MKINSKSPANVYVNVCYLFIDISGYSKSNDTKEQSTWIKYLNKVVDESLTSKLDLAAPKGQILKFYSENNLLLDPFYWDKMLLPTGDGMCICLLEDQAQINLALKLSKEVLDKLKDAPFKVRIGIEYANDCLIKGINNQINIIGAGINLCQRIMDSALDGEIHLGAHAFEHANFDSLKGKDYLEQDVVFKHGKEAKIYRLKEREKPDISYKDVFDLRNSFTNLNSLIKSANHSNKYLIRAIKTRLNIELEILNSFIHKKSRTYIIRSEAAYRRILFSQLIGITNENEIYSTFSPLDFWLRDSSQSPIKKNESFSKFIEANKNLVESGATLKRVILVDEAIFSGSGDKIRTSDRNNYIAVVKDLYE